MGFHAYYIWFLSLSLFKEFFAKTLNDVRFNFRWNVITLSCFFTHFQRLAVCPILNKMNKKPILPCTAPMGECAVNTNYTYKTHDTNGKQNGEYSTQPFKYIHVANGNPNRPFPPHASFCILDSNTNKAIGISKRLHSRSFFIFYILPQCNFACNTQIKSCCCDTQSLKYTAHSRQSNNTCTFLQL